ncbi:hypothetical protein KY49_6996 [Burkholderia sp. MSHR3999]|uniref:hypothetical protein n=1 Tax=Burkholderia sp. MSHR3999 TaxID=1542965 RepID=UPI0005B6F9A0|nr:hypothetical protein [Burkholderia sp. MSHR3999]KIP17077.1 hypothetical protein KY49_6996 [Burkholderia sp. MSHR3999]
MKNDNGSEGKGGCVDEAFDVSDHYLEIREIELQTVAFSLHPQSVVMAEAVRPVVEDACSVRSVPAPIRRFGKKLRQN